MNIKNNKGFWCFIPHCCALVCKGAAAAAKLSPGGSQFTGVGLIGAIFAGILLVPMIWHIPAWEKAKKDGTTDTYQKTEQWPQQLTDKLPGGNPGRTIGN